MKILLEGMAIPKTPRFPWRGVKFLCPNCNAVVELEEGDPFHGDPQSPFVHCPTNLCDELIYLVRHPYIHAADFRGRDLSKNL